MALLREAVLLFLIAMPRFHCKTSNAGCSRNGSDLNKCVENRMNSFESVIKKGLPHLKMGPLDPLYVPKIRLRQGNGPVSIDITSTDQVFKGIINYRITSAKIDLQNYKMEFAVTLPWLHVGGKSKMEGRILAFPINGNGESWSNYTMVSGKAVLKGHPVEKEGKEYFSLDTVKFDMVVKKATVEMSGLFNGNEELASAMNKVMSENWEIIFKELKPVIDQTVEELIKDMATKIFNHYSLDKLFPK